MQETFKHSRFALLYLWISKAKYTMGIFYVAFVLLYLLFGTVHLREQATLDLLTSIEMLFACFFIGLAQQAIAPVNRLTVRRSLLWLACGASITLAFTLIFGWFAAFPPWCLILFVFCVVLGMLALLVSHYLELFYETRRLNQRLESFQSGMKQNSSPTKKQR